MKKKFDFSGYATKANVKCGDGRVILPDAFKNNDGKKVPLVWQHLRDTPDNILGHGFLEHRDDGTYLYGVFNDTPKGKQAKELVKHGDIDSISIFANRIIEKSKRVSDGDIVEAALVVAGANPGAKIDNLMFEHSDNPSDDDIEEAFIWSGESIEHSFTEEEPKKNSEPTTTIEHASTDDNDETVEDVFNTLSEKQKELVYALIGTAIEDVEKDSEIEHSIINGGEETMKKNIFDSQIDNKNKFSISHDDFKTILKNAQECGSFRAALSGYLEHADYGIEDIEILFPDARAVSNTPDFISRRMEWVAGVLTNTKHSPFSRIKSIAADITADEARAKGYVKGTKKKEEVIKLLKRITTPTTIYKKQKLDRDDIIDITDLNVVVWIKGEMRILINEEIARAVLVGDGRAADDPDKVNPENIRPIYGDDDMYAYHFAVGANATPADIIEQFIRNRVNYRGSGNPSLYTTSSVLADMLLLTDTLGRRLYNTITELASVLRVKEIVEVPPMENMVREDEEGVKKELLGIMVNLSDYTIGADKGGELTLFDDFDIDYNQYKYLLETRISGALTHPMSALVMERTVTTG